MEHNHIRGTHTIVLSRNHQYMSHQCCSLFSPNVQDHLHPFVRRRVRCPHSHRSHTSSPSNINNVRESPKFSATFWLATCVGLIITQMCSTPAERSQISPFFVRGQPLSSRFLWVSSIAVSIAVGLRAFKYQPSSSRFWWMSSIATPMLVVVSVNVAHIQPMCCRVDDFFNPLFSGIGRLDRSGRARG